MSSEDPRTRAPRAPERATAPEPGDRRGGRGDLWAGLDHSTAMSMELLAGILVWGGIGWLVDGWLGTRPWLFVIGVLLGFGAGFYLVLLRAHAMEREEATVHGEPDASRGQQTGDRPAEREVVHGSR